MEINIAAEKDIKTIQQLAQSIWPVCYADIISAEQINYMLGLIYSDEALSSQFEKGHEFIIAEEGNKPIGFASFSKKSIDELTTFRLHKLYVLTSLHTKGIGSALLEYVCNYSMKDGAEKLELNVNKNNPAISFYTKKDFSMLREEVIDIGNGYVMDDYVMIKQL